MVEYTHSGDASATATAQIHTITATVTVAERRGFRGLMIAMYLEV